MNKFEKLIREYSDRYVNSHRMTAENRNADHALSQKLHELALHDEVPQIISIMLSSARATNNSFNDIDIIRRVEESNQVLKKTADLAKVALCTIIQSALNASTGHGCAGPYHDMDIAFYRLQSRTERQNLWGSQWELPCFLIRGLIMDISSGINVDNPSKDDLLKSEVIKVATIYQCNREKIEAYINENFE